MKLFVIFDNDNDINIEISKMDVVLVNTIKLQKKYIGIAGEVIYLDMASLYSSCDKDKLQWYCDVIKETLIRLNEDLINIANYSYFKLYLPSYLVLYKITQIVDKYDIDTIVLYGGCNLVFMPSLGGEGEGKRRFYNSKWLFNPIIYQYFFGKIRIEWKKKNNHIALKLVHWLREGYYRVRTILHAIYRTLILGKCNYHLETCREYELIYCNLPIQMNHLEYIRDRKRNKVDSKMYVKEKEAQTKTNILSIPLSIVDIVRVVLKLFAIDYKTNNRQIQICGIELNNKVFIRCNNTFLLLYYLELYENHKNFKTLKSNISTCITNMTFGTDIFAVHNACKKFGIKHINYQYVAMSALPLPIYDMADEYYLYSNSVYKLYSRFSSSFRYYLYLEKKPIFDTYMDLNSMAIFLQPDSYTDAYIEILNLLGRTLDEINSKLMIFIKKHPRQDKMSEFQSIVDNFRCFSWIESDTTAMEVIESVDVVASICSSILYEAFSYGKMGIILNINGMYTEHIVNNDSCCPQVNLMVESIEQLINIFIEPDIWYSKYIERYKKYIEGIEENGIK